MFLIVLAIEARRATCFLFLAITLLSSGAAWAADCNTPEECKALLQSDRAAVELRLRWQPLGEIKLADNVGFVFPSIKNVSGLYRIEMHRPRTLVYIGETENLKRRFAEYRSPGQTQKTNRRICAELLRTLRAAGSASVSVVTDDAWLCTSGSCTAAHLGIGNHRKLLEQLAIFAVPSGIHVLNRDRILTGKERKLIGVETKVGEPGADGNCS